LIKLINRDFGDIVKNYYFKDLFVTLEFYDGTKIVFDGFYKELMKEN
jgi:hypothetical protein